MRLVLPLLAVCGCSGTRSDALDTSLGSQRADAAVDGTDASAADDAGDVRDPDSDASEASADAGDASEDGSTDPDAGLPPRANAVDCSQPAAYTRLSTATEGMPAAGLRLWLRADTGVWLDPQGRVCAWDDQSGLRNDLFQDDPVARPARIAQLGNEPAVDLDPTQYVARDDVLGIAPTSGRTIVAVYALDNPSARFGIVQGQLDTNWAWLGIDDNTFQTAGNLYGCYLPSQSYDTDAVTTTDAHVRSLVIDSLAPGQPQGATFRCRMSGADLTLKPTVSTNMPLQDFSGADTTRVGWGLSNPGDGRVAEVLMYDRALNDAELSQVERSLAARYGL